MDSETPAVPASAIPHAMRDQPVPETPALASLRAHVASSLKAEAFAIAQRWETRARSVALRDNGEGAAADHLRLVAALVESLAAALASGGAVAEDMVMLGMAFGTQAFASRRSLHHTLKGLELLNAMALYAVETAAEERLTGELTLIDGIRLCRRFQQGSSLLTLVVTKGYSQAANSEMRDRFRHMRHDLRNPLGTIKSVLALMDDETIPADERSNPRFRAMAKRNARSLGELIGERLSDAEAVLPAHVVQTISLRTIACTVRRDLRAEAMARNAVILVAGTKLRLQVDAVGLELMLHEVLVAALQESVAGDELNIGFGEPDGDRATVSLRRTPNRPLVSQREVIERLRAFATDMGAGLDVGEQLVLSFPARRHESSVSSLEVSTQVPATSDMDGPARSAHGNARHDIGGTREREHGQSSSL